MLDVIVLAAGKGSRMRSPLPKVLHKLAGKSLLGHTLAVARALSPERIHVVVGHGAEAVRAEASAQDVTFHYQAEQLGTGHAVAQALPACNPNNVALVLFGDVPLMSAATLSALIEKAGTDPVMLAANVPDPAGYGRVIRDSDGLFMKVVEHKDASDTELSVSEVNTGVLAAPVVLLTELLSKLNNDNSQGEYYLPDVLGIARTQGSRVQVVVTEDPIEMMGVNDRLQLESLERTFQVRLAEDLMRNGVAISDRHRLDIRGELACGAGVSIDVNVIFEGKVTLGDGVRIGANTVIKDAIIGSNSAIHPFSHLEQVNVGTGCSVGPYARLRPGTQLCDGARVGNFVETKNATLGAGSKANHLAYIGDTRVGSESNIGAGTITCNYDGVNKHQTTLGDGVFIGSNSTLVAPVSIDDGAFVAAGSVVTKPVASKDLAVGRARQKNISGWQSPASKDA